MCHHHYRWLVCDSLKHGMDRATQEWSDALDRVYKVEVSLGLRPSPYEGAIKFTVEDNETKFIKAWDEGKVRKVRPRTDDSEDFI